MEGLSDDGVVGLLGNGTFATFMEGSEVILHKSDHAVHRAGAIGDGHEKVRMGHEVCIHFQQGALLQYKSRQDHLYTHVKHCYFTMLF